MKLFHYFIYFFTLVQLAFSADATTTTATTTTATSTSVTLVWATGTNSLGITTVTQLVFTQTFMKTYTTAIVTWSSGEIGLGSLSGTVGQIRSYTMTTISQAGGDSLIRGGSGIMNSNGLWISLFVALTLVFTICM